MLFLWLHHRTAQVSIRAVVVLPYVASPAYIRIINLLLVLLIHL